MEGGLLTTTSTEELEPLGEAHQRSYELIVGTVEDDPRLGAAHVALFAEPRGSNYGDKIDWYGGTGGRGRPLESLEEAERAAAEAKLEELIAAIQSVADEKLAERDTNVQSIGEALANALRYPGPQSVFVTGSGESLQPVLVNWAWVDDTKKAVAGSLSGTGGAGSAPSVKAAAMAAAAPVVAPVVIRDRPAGTPPWLWWLLWLGWLLLALMIGAILYLMVEACALRIPGLPNYCPPPGPSVLNQERRAAVLRDQIAAVERQIGIADRACQPEIPQQTLAPLPEVTPPVQQAERDEIDERLNQAGAARGDLTFSLVWETIDDLDLHVNCPQGGRLFYSNRNACSGTLDIDSNAGNSTRTSRPVENAYFNGPAPGAYALRVNLFDSPSGSGRKNFQLRIREGSSVQTLRGSVSSANPNWTYTYRTGSQ
ncbi:MAG: hypothetical protein AAGH70_00800 [Pseudomonadota bacterium]